MKKSGTHMRVAITQTIEAHFYERVCLAVRSKWNLVTQSQIRVFSVEINRTHSEVENFLGFNILSCLKNILLICKVGKWFENRPLKTLHFNSTTVVRFHKRDS